MAKSNIVDLYVDSIKLPEMPFYGVPSSLVPLLLEGKYQEALAKRVRTKMTIFKSSNLERGCIFKKYWPDEAAKDASRLAEYFIINHMKQKYDYNIRPMTTATMIPNTFCCVECDAIMEEKDELQLVEIKAYNSDKSHYMQLQAQLAAHSSVKKAALVKCKAMVGDWHDCSVGVGCTWTYTKNRHFKTLPARYVMQFNDKVHKKQGDLGKIHIIKNPPPGGSDVYTIVPRTPYAPYKIYSDPKWNDIKTYGSHVSFLLEDTIDMTVVQRDEKLISRIKEITHKHSDLMNKWGVDLQNRLNKEIRRRKLTYVCPQYKKPKKSKYKKKDN